MNNKEKTPEQIALEHIEEVARTGRYELGLLNLGLIT